MKKIKLSNIIISFLGILGSFASIYAVLQMDPFKKNRVILDIETIYSNKFPNELSGSDINIVYRGDTLENLWETKFW